MTEILVGIPYQPAHFLGIGRGRSWLVDVSIGPWQGVIEYGAGYTLWRGPAPEVERADDLAADIAYECELVSPRSPGGAFRLPWVSTLERWQATGRLCSDEAWARHDEREARIAAQYGAP